MDSKRKALFKCLPYIKKTTQSKHNKKIKKIIKNHWRGTRNIVL